MDSDLPGIALTLVIAGAILIMGTFVVSSAIDSGTQQTNPEETQATVVLDGPGTYGIAETIGTDHTVFNSRGYAVNLTGANDSFIRSSDDINVNLANDTWTVSTWAARDENTTDTQAILALDGSLEIAYNGSQNRVTAWYYDAGSSESVTLSGSAPTDAKTLSNIVIVRNQTTLTLYRNDTQADQVTLDGSGTVSKPSTTNWDGRIDEIRVDQDAWNASQRSTHYNNPIDPIVGDRRGRVMFDEPNRATQRLFYSPGDIQTSNATFSQGLPGQKMVSASVLLQQSDYEWLRTGPQIKILSSGELANAPAAYVDYLKHPQESTVALLNGFESAVQLGGLALILLPLGMILFYLFGLRGGR